MKVYLIDPFTKTVTAVEYDGKSENIYKLIDCSLFTVSYIGAEQDAIFIDDEGLMKKPDSQEFFLFKRDDGSEQFLAGKGLVVGCDDEGETIEPSVTLDYVQLRVEFIDNRENGALYADYLLGQSPVISFVEL